jgi:hypothetical protein
VIAVVALYPVILVVLDISGVELKVMFGVILITMEY